MFSLSFYSLLQKWVGGWVEEGSGQILSLIAYCLEQMLIMQCSFRKSVRVSFHWCKLSVMLKERFSFELMSKQHQENALHKILVFG